MIYRVWYTYRFLGGATVRRYRSFTYTQEAEHLKRYYESFSPVFTDVVIQEIKVGST